MTRVAIASTSRTGAAAGQDLADQTSGGAGDHGAFKQTHVFCGTDAFSNGAVALEILSNKPIGIGARHGWVAAAVHDAVQCALGEAAFVGFNSYGQIVRSEGQFSGFHNCTAVVLVLPD
jgi:hypothetical protein